MSPATDHTPPTPLDHVDQPAQPAVPCHRQSAGIRRRRTPPGADPRPLSPFPPSPPPPLTLPPLPLALFPLPAPPRGDRDAWTPSRDQSMRPLLDHLGLEQPHPTTHHHTSPSSPEEALLTRHPSEAKPVASQGAIRRWVRSPVSSRTGNGPIGAPQHVFRTPSTARCGPRPHRSAPGCRRERLPNRVPYRTARMLGSRR